MNCDAAERNILLKQTGELGVTGRFLLRRHLNRCANCRAYERDALRVMTDSRAWNPARDINTENLAAIVREARDRQPNRRELFTFRPSAQPVRLWRPLVLYATVALVLLTGWWMVTHRSTLPGPSPVAQVEPSAEAPQATWTWDDDLDEAIANLNQLMTTAAEDVNGDLDSIARELLKLEEQKI